MRASQPLRVAWLVAADDRHSDSLARALLLVRGPPQGTVRECLDGRSAQEIGVILRPRESVGERPAAQQRLRGARREPGYEREGEEVTGLHGTAFPGEDPILVSRTVARGPPPKSPREKACTEVIAASASLRCAAARGYDPIQR
jgi:hypothetical protein